MSRTAAQAAAVVLMAAAVALAVPGTPSGASDEGPLTWSDPSTGTETGVFASETSGSIVTSGPALFSSEVPTAGSVATVTPLTVSVTASDTLPLTGGVGLRLDGVPLSVYPDYPVGHWETDGWEDWWVVDDYSRAVIRVSATPADGAHEVTVTVVNSAGSTSTCSWGFEVAVPPRVTAVVPASGSVVTSDQPLVSARITDNDASDQATMTLDGTVVPLAYTLATRTYSHLPAVPLAEGVHAVSFTVEDAGGRTAVREWTFTVDAVADTTFSAMAPAPGSTVTTWATPISLTITDTAAVYYWNLKAYVDGVTATVNADYPIGYWVPDPWEPWFEVTDWGYVNVFWNSGVLPDGQHTVLVRTVNSRGLPATCTWDFEVQAPPRISGTLPLKSRSLQPTVSAYVSDNSTGAIGVTMTVDGSTVAASYDPMTHALAWQPGTPFSDFSTHTVRVDALDAAGNGATRTWSFAVQTVADARFSARAPFPGTVLDTSTVAVSVTATDASALTGPCGMAVDGSAVTPVVSYPVGHWEWDYDSSWYVVDDPGYVVLTYGMTGIADGTHTVEATVTDSEGLAAADSWQFRVESPPRATGLLPPPGSETPTRTPVIGADVTDNGTDPIGVTLVVDGVAVPASLDATGRLEYVPAVALTDDATHTVSLDVEDSRGNASHYAWSFRVETCPDMPDSGACASCHVGYPEPNHPMGNCSGCHHAGNGHGVLLPSTPVLGCSCHGGGGHGPYQISGVSPYYYTWQCTDCHKPLYPWIPRHPDDNSALHTTSRSLAACRPCHKSELTREHYRYPIVGVKYDCSACHRSASSAVTQAIAARDTVCESCHGSVGAYHDDHASSQSAVLANGEKPCGTCHSTDLWVEHTKPTTTRRAEECLLCHTVTDDSTVTPAVAPPWSGSCDVTGCHEPGSAREMHGYWCLGCHDVSQPDFAISKVDFRAAAPVDGSACAACHWIGAHPSGHPQDRDCKACHSAWPSRTDWYYAKVLAASGWFDSLTSLEATAGRIHDVHAAGSWPAQVTDRALKCAGCHSAVACDACHADPAHTSHAATAYPAASYRATYGASSVQTGTDTSAMTSSFCANVSCHALANAVREGGPASIEETSPAFAYTGVWARNVRTAGTSGGTWAYSATGGSAVTITFTGQGDVRLFGGRRYNAGIFEYSLDSGATRTVDCYSSDSSARAIVVSATVGPGGHVLRLRVTGTKNAYSTGRYVYVDALAVDDGGRDRGFIPACSACHATRVADHW